jgi:hypothetical protein
LKFLFFIIDGTKLPPICIFKGKRLSRGEQIPSGIIVWFQENGWMDANLMKKYVDYLNDNIKGNGRAKVPMMMVYDSFKGHLEDSVKSKFRDSGFDLAVIPGGLTSICQPLDVAINKPFKDNLRKEWHLWMAGGGAGLTVGGNLKRAKLSDVCGWVKRSWDNISNEIIVQSFKTCNISNEINKDFDNKENEEDFEITDDSEEEDDGGSIDMKVPQAG